MLLLLLLPLMVVVVVAVVAVAAPSFLLDPTKAAACHVFRCVGVMGSVLIVWIGCANRTPQASNIV